MHPEPSSRAGNVVAVAGAVLLMGFLAFTPGISFSEDLGRHLLLGEIISSEHFVPDTNFLTLAHPGHPFVNHHWLSEVLLYQLHRLAGYRGLLLFKTLAMMGALGLAMVSGGRAGRPRWLWLAGILSAVLLGFRAHVRPELFTFLGVPFLLFCFERIRRGRRWPWVAAVPCLWAWSNAHIYFVFGLGMCAAFAAERLVVAFAALPPSASLRRKFAAAWRLAAWLALLLAACAANPSGVSALLYPLRIFSDYAVGITENASVRELWRQVVNPAMLALPFASAMAAWAAWANRRERPASSLILLGAVLSAWTMARNVPLLALALPGAVAAIPPSPRRLPARLAFPLRAAGWGMLGLLNLALAACVATGAWHRPFPSPVGPTPFGLDDEDSYLALRRLLRAGLPGEVFTDYNLGSLAGYNLWPHLRSYVDNRPEAFPGSFWRTEYAAALSLGPAWDDIRARRGFRTVAVSLHGVEEAFALELMRRPEWVLVHVDPLMGVWVRDEESTRPFLEREAFSADRLEAFDRALGESIAGLANRPFWRRQVEADRAVFSCYALICIGEAEKAWPHVWALHRLYPDYQIVHELLRVSAPPEFVPAVMDVMERRARWPLAAKQVLDWGRVLEAKGLWQEARAVYRRGRFFFPESTELLNARLRAEDFLYANP